MAGLKKSRKKEFFDIEAEYNELNIENVKAEEVFAMVPLKMSRTAGTKAVKVELYAPVRTPAEFDRIMEALREKIKDAKEMEAIIKAAMFSRKCISETQLDTDGRRAFVFAKDTPENAIKKFMYDLFGVGKKPKERLYFDSLKDLSIIDWRTLEEEVRNNGKEFKFELEFDTGKKKAEPEFSRENEGIKVENNRILATEKVKAAAKEEENTKEVHVLRFGSPANTIEGKAEVVEGKVEELRDKGASPQLLQREVKTVRANKDKPPVVPVVNKPVEPYHIRIAEGGRDSR